RRGLRAALTVPLRSSDFRPLALQSTPVEEHVIQRYKSREGATSYNTKYDDEAHKRLNNKFEFKLVRRCMERVGTQGRVLDLPSGTGRLTPIFKPWATTHVESDVSREMLKYCRENTK